MASRHSLRRTTRHTVTEDGTVLASFHAPAQGRRVGTALMTNTQAQHIGNLTRTAEGLAAHGWDVVAVDLRGHGGSVGPRAPLAHMDPGIGWQRLTGDFRAAAAHAFEGVPWGERLVVAANIGAPLCLEALKAEPDLARQIVFAAPPPNQPALLRFARAVMRVRGAMSSPTQPDELTMHQLYTFLGGQIAGRTRLIDVVSADPEVTAELDADPLSWPTPTIGYFSELFRGIESAWRWPARLKVATGTQMLILYGGDDPMTARGAYVNRMCKALQKLGPDRLDTLRIEGGRAGLVIDERTLGISRHIAGWCAGGLGRVVPQDAGDLQAVTSSVLEGLGACTEPLSPDELVELCYTAIGNETRWVELLYRLAHSMAGDDGEADGPERSDDVLAGLMPHYARALQIDRQIMSAAAVGTVLQGVLDRLGIGLAIVTRDLDVVFANAAFAARLGALANASLAQTDNAAIAGHLRRLASPDFAEAVRAGGDRVPLTEGGAVLGVHFRPAALRQAALTRGGASGVIAIRATGDNTGALAELLQFAHGLTEKEAEVVAHLCRGLSPDAIATAMGVSLHTTRTHLKRAFEKTGTAGQTELVALVMNGPLGLFSG